MKTDYLIIGNCYAGISALKATRQIDTKSDITIISDEPYYAYCRPLISDFLADKINQEDIFFVDKDFYQKHNCQLLLSAKAIEIDFDKRMVYLHNKKSITYKKLLIATGSKPAIPPIKNLKGFFTFTTLDDAKAIKQQIKENCLIIGCGLIGFKLAEALRCISKDLKITMVEMQDRILPQILDKESSDFVLKKIKKEVKIITSHYVKEIKDGYAILDDDKRLGFDILFLAAGVRPSVDFIKDNKLKLQKGAIVVDEFLRTTQEGVYAAGDVCLCWDWLRGQWRQIAIMPIAERQGQIAGYNIASKEPKYLFKGAVSMNSVVLFEQKIISVGDFLNYDQVIQYKDENNLKRLFFKEKELVGFILIGEAIETAGRLFYMLKKEEFKDEKDKLKLLGNLTDLFEIPNSLY